MHLPEHQVRLQCIKGHTEMNPPAILCFSKSVTETGSEDWHLLVTKKSHACPALLGSSVLADSMGFADTQCLFCLHMLSSLRNLFADYYFL